MDNFKNEIMTIAKNSSLSIGLAITLAIAIFFGARWLGATEMKIENHEQLDTHEGTMQLFVPKGEVKLQFEYIERELKEIKETQKQILKELRK